MCVIVKVPEGQHPIYPTIPVPDTIKIYVKDKLAKEGISKYVNINDFHQDIYGITLSDGTYYPPTSNWKSSISIMFEKNKKDPFFCVVVPELNDEIVDGQFPIELLMEDFENAIETILDYKDCVCNIDQKCKFHTTFNGSKTELYIETKEL